jgi:hypothetical protein
MAKQDGDDKDQCNSDEGQSTSDDPESKEEQKKRTQRNIKDKIENPDDWEIENERFDPVPPKDGGESRRITWRNKKTGERLEEHILEDLDGNSYPKHPHYKRPKE